VPSAAAAQAPSPHKFGDIRVEQRPRSGSEGVFQASRIGVASVQEGAQRRQHLPGGEPLRSADVIGVGTVPAGRRGQGRHRGGDPEVPGVTRGREDDERH
jgi:hypothetical protein